MFNHHFQYQDSPVIIRSNQRSFERHAGHKQVVLDHHQVANRKAFIDASDGTGHEQGGDTEHSGDSDGHCTRAHLYPFVRVNATWMWVYTFHKNLSICVELADCEMMYDLPE